GGDEVGHEVRGVRRAETGDRIPTGRRGIAQYCRVEGVVPGRDVEEVVRVPRRVGTDLVERRIEQAQPSAVDLVGHGNEPGPFRATERGAADVVPAGRARIVSAQQSAEAVGWQRLVHERAGAGARLQRYIRNTALRTDRRAAGRQRVLVVGLREDL